MSIIFKSSNKSGPCWGYNCTAVTRRRRCVLQLAGGRSRWLLEKNKKDETANTNNAAGPRSGPALSPLCLHVVMDTGFFPPLHPRWLLLSSPQSHLDAVERRVFTVTTRARVLFWLTEPNQKKNNSSPRLAAWFLHRRLSDVVCHFSVRSVVKRPLETQYSNKCFQPLQQTVELIPDPASPAAHGADISPRAHADPRVYLRHMSTTRLRVRNRPSNDAHIVVGNAMITFLAHLNNEII